MEEKLMAACVFVERQPMRHIHRAILVGYERWREDRHRLWRSGKRFTVARAQLWNRVVHPRRRTKHVPGSSQGN